MTELPPRLRALVDEVVEAAELEETSARRVRADLEEHLREGLARGRSVDDLVERFGSPAQAVHWLRRYPAPRSWRGEEGEGLLASTARDLMHAVRSLLKSPGIAAAAVVVLALGLAANTVVFTALSEILLRPLPVEDPSTLVDVWADVPGANSFTGFSWGDYRSYREENRVLDELAAFSGRRLDLGGEGSTRRIIAQFVTPSYFRMLGLTASLGTMAFPEPTRFGDEPVAVLSHRLWSESYGGDRSVVGRTIQVEGRGVTVVGVGPEGFSGHFIGFPVDLWLPVAAMDPLVTGFDPDDPTGKELEMIARLRPGVTPEAAEASLDAIAERIERRLPDTNRGHRVGVTPTTGLDHSLHGPVRTFVAIVTVVALLVLVIACLNVGSILLVRSMSRGRELAVRVALGAGRIRIVRHLAAESLVLVAMGAVVGVGLAMGANAVLADTLRAVAAGIGLDLSPDWRVAALTLISALVAAALATGAPAMHVLRRNPSDVLRARAGDHRGGARLRSALVVAQVAVSVVLVVGTGLFVRALVVAARSDPGFDAASVATFPLDPPDESGGTAAVAEPGQASEARREVVREIAALPGVEAVVVASAPPVGVGRTPAPVEIPGVLPPPQAGAHLVDVRTVGPGYLGAIGVDLLSGRDIRRRDEGSGSPVAVVSAAFERRFGQGRDLVGTTIRVDGQDVRIVGIAADARYVVQDDTPDPLVYRSPGPDGSPLAFVTVRAADPLELAEEVHAAVRRVRPGYRRAEMRTARDVLDAALLPQRLGAALVGTMGLGALFLAAVGLYGVIRFTVARDTHELGVRLALGGGRRELLWVVLRKGAGLVLLGTFLGVAFALVLAPGLSGFLGDVSPLDPVTYGAVVAVFAVVALVASWMPARRAMRIDAARALRAE